MWPLYKRSTTFCCFDLSRERNLVWIHVIDFFASYDPLKNLTCITTQLNHFDYSHLYLEGGWTLNPITTPMQLIEKNVSTLEMFPMVYITHPHKTNLYNLTCQFACQRRILPLGICFGTLNKHLNCSVTISRVPIIFKTSVNLSPWLVTDCYEAYLGVLFDPCLTWCNHVNSISSRNSKRICLTGGNWQKWKRVFLTCPCHEIYRNEAVGLKSCKNTWKFTIFVKMWNLGQYRENLIFCQ